MMSVIQGAVSENVMDKNEKLVLGLSPDSLKPFKSVFEC